MLPVLIEELPAFGVTDIRKRLFSGGLPEPLISEERDESFYSEWLDSYFARDVQELFKVEKRTAFLKLLTLLLRQSGSLTEVTSLAKHSGLSRPTVINYLDALQVTQVMTTISPYSAGGRREIIAQKKTYAFDSGFVAFANGWNDLRETDCGNLWEHVVLESLQSIVDESKIHFWRDQKQREVDFVVPTGRKSCDAIECKWNVDSFATRGIKAFRENYPEGRNFLIAPVIGKPYRRDFGSVDVTVANASDLRQLLSKNV